MRKTCLLLLADLTAQSLKVSSSLLNQKTLKIFSSHQKSDHDKLCRLGVNYYLALNEACHSVTIL